MGMTALASATRRMALALPGPSGAPTAWARHSRVDPSLCAGESALGVYVLFFIELGSRRVHFAGCTANPNSLWVSD